MRPRPSPVDHAFRTEWTALVASMVRETGSLEMAEDAVSDAFAEASVRWRIDGAPRKPGAWLLTTARRKAIDRMRRQRRFNDRMPLLLSQSEQSDGSDTRNAEQLGDDQLALIAGCVHPALSKEAQVALTLRYVCGLNTEQIAHAFVVPAETMKKRLSRAKKKIDGAGIPFVVPEAAHLTDRLSAICGVIYAVFNEGYTSTSGAELIRGSLCDEAIWLSELLCQLVPDDAEVRALAALILLTDSRRYARTDVEGLPVLLEDQDRSRWDRDKIERGRAHLARSIEVAEVGPYRLMASIAALHAQATSVEDTQWNRIASLYGALIALNDSPILRLNQAAAIAWSERPATGLALMDQLSGELDRYPYLHSSRASLLAKLDRPTEARAALDRAIELSDNEAEIRWMTRRRNALGT